VDLQLYLRVLWRFRLLVAIGLLLAFALAFLSHVRVSLEGGSPTFSYRQAEIWTSRGLLWVTGEGFPGQLAPSEAEPTVDFRGLAVLYATLGQGDAVRENLLRDGPLEGTLEVRPSEELPFINVEAFSPSPQAARALAGRQMNALIDHVVQQQRADGIPQGKRVLVKVLRQPGPPQLLEGRSMQRPAVIFVTAMIAVLGLAFILENLRPRVRPVAHEDVRAILARDTERRSA
jgi:hypothetical protein